MLHDTAYEVVCLLAESKLILLIVKYIDTILESDMLICIPEPLTPCFGFGMKLAKVRAALRLSL